MPDQTPLPLADVAIGLFCLTMAVATLVFGWEATPMGASLGALVLFLLGADALVSAARRKRSLLSRIGPLP
jgi:hypothetical protein